MAFRRWAHRTILIFMAGLKDYSYKKRLKWRYSLACKEKVRGDIDSCLGTERLRTEEKPERGPRGLRPVRKSSMDMSFVVEQSSETGEAWEFALEKR